jgi:hypothetical protein
MKAEGQTQISDLQARVCSCECNIEQVECVSVEGQVWFPLQCTGRVNEVLCNNRLLAFIMHRIRAE